MSATLPVSVVIPTHNRRDSLRRTLLSLTRQTYDLSAVDVVIADSGSTDGTGEMVNTFCAPYTIRYIPLVKRYQSDSPIVRNVGALHASGEILIFVDSDIIFRPHFIQEHVTCHETVKHALVCGGVFHLLPTGCSEQQILSDCAHEDLFGQLAAYQAGLIEFSGNLASCRFPWSYCFGANYSIRKKDNLAVGMVDETYVARGFEAHDTEFAYRCYAKGLSMVFSRYALAYHDWGSSPPADSSDRTMRVMAGLSYACDKHRSTELAAYANFREHEYEHQLQGLLRSCQGRTFPVLDNETCLEWMDKILGLPRPRLSLLLISRGITSDLKTTLLALDRQTQPHEDYEVIVYDVSAPQGIGSSRTSETADLLVQKLPLQYCLRYYGAGIPESLSRASRLIEEALSNPNPIALTQSARLLKQITEVVPQSVYASASTFARSLSRIGWYFASLNNGSLRTRLRGKFLHVLDDNQPLHSAYVSECLESPCASSDPPLVLPESTEAQDARVGYRP
jgi:glycosyltransferase involved in cell wall biosynthesis